MRRRQTLRLSAGPVLAALLPVLTLRPARAHGDGGHAAPAKPLVREQTDWGIAGDPANVTRRVTVRMSDRMRFTPDRLQVRLGETLRITVHNDGALLHEFVIGTPAALDEHAALMLRFPGMEHDEPYMAHVPAGQQGELVWQFNRPGRFRFACLIAGHYQAGMVGQITVEAA